MGGVIYACVIFGANAAMAAINVALFAAEGSPANLGAAVFSGFVALWMLRRA